jgi:hypothetical protein
MTLLAFLCMVTRDSEIVRLAAAAEMRAAGDSEAVYRSASCGLDGGQRLRRLFQMLPGVIGKDADDSGCHYCCGDA